MFRFTSGQTSFLEPTYSLSATKVARLTTTWAWHFREKCLPLIDEMAFAACYSAENGRPNVSVRLLVGILILKEVFDYTDAQALEAVDYDLRWQLALGLTIESVAPCQKTLHNFRAVLAEHERAHQVFCTLTDRLLVELGVVADRQRLDSTQIGSNIALLSRLSRFCETYRLLLSRLDRYAPDLLTRIVPTVQRRYLRPDGTATHYDDARSSEGRRRLAVCARDAWRLVDALRGVELPPPVTAAYALVQRVLEEHCLPVSEPPRPLPDDADAAEAPVPVRLREKGEVAAGGLQTPHDPDATYGHKGTGYTVTISETVGNEARPELLTHLALTTAQATDQHQTVPVVTALQERGLQPSELLTDASFGSTANVLACQALGTELVAPVTGGAGAPAETPVIRVACLPWAPPSACSQGVAALTTELLEEAARYQVRFAADGCAGCPQSAGCPAKLQADGTRLFRIARTDAVTTLRRWYETTDAFPERYRWRSGIEGTNSECKRRHGLGRLRVRGWSRVWVAVCFKGLACNVKRALQYWGTQQRKHALSPAG